MLESSIGDRKKHFFRIRKEKIATAREDND